MGQFPYLESDCIKKLDWVGAVKQDLGIVSAALSHGIGVHSVQVM